MRLPKIFRNRQTQNPPMTFPKTCCRNRDDGTSCPNVAKWRPRFWVHPVGEQFGPEPLHKSGAAEISPGVGLCDEHRNETVRDLINTDDAKRTIRVVFHQQGKKEPDLDDVRLDWVPL